MLKDNLVSWYADTYQARTKNGLNNTHCMPRQIGSTWNRVPTGKKEKLAPGAADLAVYPIVSETRPRAQSAHMRRRILKTLTWCIICTALFFSKFMRLRLTPPFKSPSAEETPTIFGDAFVGSRYEATCEPRSTEIETNMIALREYFPIKPRIKEENDSLPEWVKLTCPEVVEHFNTFPLFSKGWNESMFALSDTIYGMRAACMVKIIKDLAASVGYNVFVHAGSHLGALLHGGPIPWDDDTDLILDFSAKGVFLELCEEIRQKEYPLKCYEHTNSVKVYSTDTSEQDPRNPWTVPIVDVFFFVIRDGRLHEVTPDGTLAKESYVLGNYYPTRVYYFAGVYVYGPQERIAYARYDVKKCILPQWNHRKAWVSKGLTTKELDCCELAKHFPFIVGNILKTDFRMKQLIFYEGITSVPLHTGTRAIREASLNSDDNNKRVSAATLTSHIADLNDVEVDNSISRSCVRQANKTDLRVVVFNMERGRSWLDAALVLEGMDADVIILNEMDIGMARSQQQHTTRLLAYRMQMNFAWGIEFIELTGGTKAEQMSTINQTDFEGLHGNAILSKCKLTSPVIHREYIGPYFDGKPSALNAFGFEKRLGGRMALLATTEVNGIKLVVGSLHKITTVYEEIKRYIRNSYAVLGGDQPRVTCSKMSLKYVENSKNAWPVTCSEYGRYPGDVICTNLQAVDQANVTLPCVRTGTGEITLSDHAIVDAALFLEKLQN